MGAPRAAAIFCIGAGLAVLGLAPVAAADRSPSEAARLEAMAGPRGEAEYHIGPLDKLDITVFEVSDLSVRKLQVDASGRIIFPLIGEVIATGKTTTELANEIAARLGEKYLQSPQVSVTVEESLSRKVTVEGAVNEAGVFELKGRTSLLEAVARAKGVSKGANLHRVSIIRIVDGAPHAATFDLAAIGMGRAPNPEVVGDDVVIVDSSRAKSFWNGLVQALPALYLLNFL
ncbi:MAG TPA: polysaccharide biosynthesis/export family protein [Caulobacteraceae bacterium]|jgi:polysaccharide export outer membrane protein|nr:polysaccharide biosynthesis/export family protein [Caulobacteraceae bacterium]